MNSIFVYRPGAIGDTILTLPAIEALRHCFPKYRITYAGNSACLPLLPVDEGLSADDTRLLSLFQDRPRTWQEFDYYAIFARQPAGLVPGVRREPLEAVRRGLHVADWLVDAVAPDFPDRQPRLPMAGPFLPGTQAPEVVVHPGAGSHAKRWPAERFAALVNELGRPAVIASGPADGDAAQRVAAAVRVPVSVLPQRTLVALAAELIRHPLFVGNDSGITHLAAALGVPTVALYVASDPDTWGVRGPHTRRLAGSDIPTQSALAACLELLG